MMLESNKTVLEKVFPDLYARLLQESALKTISSNDLQLVGTPSGDPSITYKGIWLHSSRNPRQESLRFIQAAFQIPPVDHQEPILLLGFGLGYVAECVREQFPENPLVIIEPNLTILLKALETRDLSRLLSAPNLIFIIDRDFNALHGLLSLFSARPHMVIPRPYREAEPDAARELMNIVSIWETKSQVNRTTVQKFGKRWVKNTILNQKYLVTTPGIRNLAGAFTSIPTLVVAAGPSLDEVLPFMPSLYERCLIISVDTALRAILRTGIEPDFVIVVDPQYWNARHLDFCDTPASCLVTEIAVYPTVLRHQFQHKLLCSSLYPLGNYLEKGIDPKGRLGAGGSVATTAFDFALHLGTSPVFIAGLDLAYPDYKTHFSGALFEERAFHSSNRFLPAETQSFRSLMGAYPFTAPSASGGTVLTDKRLSLYTAWFEARLRQLPPSLCKSLAPKGIAISGLGLGSVEELLQLPVIRSELQTKLISFFNNLEDSFFSPENQERLRNDWERERAALTGALTDLYSTTQQGLQLITNLQEAMQRGFINLMKIPLEEKLAELDRINERIGQSPIKDVAGFLFTEKPGTDSADALASYINYLNNFYTGLKESIEYQLLLLRT